MSIAGIFREVTTITASAWEFGDELMSPVSGSRSPMRPKVLRPTRSRWP